MRSHELANLLLKREDVPVVMEDASFGIGELGMVTFKPCNYADAATNTWIDGYVVIIERKKV